MLEEDFFTKSRWHVSVLMCAVLLEGEKILIIFEGMMQLRAKFSMTTHADNLSKDC